MTTALKTPYPLAIVDGAGNLTTGNVVWAYNRTTQEKLSGRFNSSSQVVVDLGNLTTELTEGDEIEVWSNGKFEDFIIHTVRLTGSNSGRGEVTLTSAAISSSLENVSL